MIELRVLIVDDSETDLTIISEALRHANITYRTVIDSRYAMQAISEFSPNIVILDLNMPVIGGIELCHQIKSNPETSNIKVIMMSASENKADIIKGVRMQVVDYLQKPVAINDLLEHLMIIDLKNTLYDGMKLFESSVSIMHSKYNHQHARH